MAPMETRQIVVEAEDTVVHAGFPIGLCLHLVAKRSKVQNRQVERRPIPGNQVGHIVSQAAEKPHDQFRFLGVFVSQHQRPHALIIAEHHRNRHHFVLYGRKKFQTGALLIVMLHSAHHLAVVQVIESV